MHRSKVPVNAIPSRALMKLYLVFNSAAACALSCLEVCYQIGVSKLRVFRPAAAFIPTGLGPSLLLSKTVPATSDIRCGRCSRDNTICKVRCEAHLTDGLFRRTFLCTSAAATLSLLPDRSWSKANALPAPAVVPLSLCGGAYCTTYTIDGQDFRAVVDTGSPFVLVVGTCGATDVDMTQKTAMEIRWGCYRGAGRPSGLADTDETFIGEDVGVAWRRGDIVLTQVKVDDAVFGVVRSYVGKGGGGSPFLGLCKRRLPRIRPTLLEQTDVAAIHFDFVKRRMELSSQSLIPQSRDALRLIDLRIAGAPVANYAVKVSRLLVNGVKIELDRPLVAIIDTGTTGVVMSDALFDSGLLPQRWREAKIEMKTERGGKCVLEAAIKNARKRELTGLPFNSPEYDEFPLVVSPVHVPWFDPERINEDCGDGQPFQCNGKPLGQKLSLLETLRLRALGVGQSPHVLIVGLAFLWTRKLTIDVDDRRLLIV